MKNSGVSPKATKRAERAINIALVIVALLFGGTLARRYLLNSNASNDVPPVEVGSAIKLSDVDWAKNGQTILLALSPECRYCTESAPFYQRLMTAVAGSGKTRVIAVFSQQADKSQQYLRKLGVTVDEIRQIPLSSIGIRSTPTLLITDNAGVVTDVRVGKLNLNDQFSVIDRLNLTERNELATDTSGPTRIDAAVLKRTVSDKLPLVIVDVEERDIYKWKHIPGAVNIPVDELEARAGDELSLTDTVVVYSRSLPLAVDAADILMSSAGLKRVSILKGGLKEWEKLDPKSSTSRK